MKKITFLLLFFCCVWVEKSLAQVELALHTAYEMPLDELKEIFRPAINYQLTVSNIDQYKNKRSSFGITLGYAKFISRQDEFYYQVNEDEYGTISYDPYHVIQLALAFRKDFIFQRFELFVGADAGYQYTIYHYLSSDPYTTDDASYIVNRAMLAPKAGFNFLINNAVSIFASARFICSIGGAGDNQRDIVNTFVSPGLGVNFRL